MIISLTVTMSNSVVSNAEEGISITNWIVESNMLTNGDLYIVEDITFKFNKKYNGVFREIVLENTSGIEDIRVAENSENKVLEYMKVEKAKKGDDNVFVVNKEKKGITIQIFSPSNEEEKTFRLMYQVKNVAIKYNDIGELYYKFLGSENKTPIGVFSVNITLPDKIVDNTVKMFAHGPSNGQIHKVSADTINLRVEHVPKSTFVEGRVLFPRELITNATNIINKDAYSDIMNEEARLQEKTQEDIIKRQVRSRLLGNISVILAVIEVLIFTVFFIKYRRPNNLYEETKHSKIPEDNTPAVVSYSLGTFISNNTIISTILDLYRKGYLKVDNGEKFSKKDVVLEDFTITKVKEEDGNLLNHEKYFIQWLIEYMGDGTTVTTKGIENYSKNQSAMFAKHYAKWNQLIKEDANGKGYFDDSTRKYGVPLVILSPVGFIISIVSLVHENLLGLFLMATSILIMIQGIMLLARRSEYGYDQQIRWKQFTKYMKEIKKKGSASDLSRYPKDLSLIYGLALGLDNDILNKFNVDTNHREGAFAYSYGWMYWYFLLNNNKNNVFNQSINNSFSGGNTTTGGGGGFSPGGGGGIGGGGAGGF